MKSSQIIIAAFAAISVAALAGCGKADRMEASLTGYAKTCIEGVTYIQFTSGAAPLYKPDGKLALCGAAATTSAASPASSIPR